MNDDWVMNYMLRQSWFIQGRSTGYYPNTSLRRQIDRGVRGGRWQYFNSHDLTYPDIESLGPPRVPLLSVIVITVPGSGCVLTLWGCGHRSCQVGPHPSSPTYEKFDTILDSHLPVTIIVSLTIVLCYWYISSRNPSQNGQNKISLVYSLCSYNIQIFFTFIRSSYLSNFFFFSRKECGVTVQGNDTFHW